MIRMSVNWNLQEHLSGYNHDQDLQQVRDAMNAQEEVSEPSMEDSNMCEQGQEDDDTGVDAPVENQATDQKDSIIYEKLNLSTVRGRSWSKSKKYVIPEPLIPPDSDDEQPSLSRRKKTQREASVSRAGVTAKFLLRHSNQFASIASKKHND